MRKVLVLMVLGLFSASALAAPKGKLQCWTDDKGVRSCGDHVPPEYAKTDREVLNAQGQVVDKKTRQKTPAEVAEAQRQADAAAAESKRRDEQAAYDQYMLQTYDSVTQMNGVRETRVSTIDGRLKLAEKSAVDAETSLQGLKDRAAAMQKDGKPVDVRLAKQIQQFESALVDGLKAQSQLKQERADTITKFDRDAARYKKLKAGEIQIGSPDLPPPAAAPNAP